MLIIGLTWCFAICEPIGDIADIMLAGRRVLKKQCFYQLKQTAFNTREF